MKLRKSQIETLRMVERLAGDAPGKPGYGTSCRSIASALGRPERSVEASLFRLGDELGYVEVIYRPLSFALYGLTDKGRSSLQEAENDG